MSDLIGSTLGPYRILEQIGLGGMATVYKAHQPGLERLVALKVLPEHYARDPLFIQRFTREAHIIAELEHPSIVPIYDFGEQNGTTYLVMRYLQAGTVKDILAYGPLPLRDAAQIVVEVAAGLDYAHRQGIIHRDVKPGNILVDKQGHAYLTDFGLAKVFESTSELTSSGTLLGTPAYMAPEQTLGKPVTPQTDVYALGAGLYEMVTGRPPYDADTPMAVALMHVHEPLPLPRQVNPALSEAVELVILKALAKEPQDRFQSAGELAQALTTVVGTEGLPTSTRLVELAGAVSAIKSGEEVTHRIRDQVRRQDSTERRRQVLRWVPWVAGGLIMAGLAIGLILSQSETTQLIRSAAQTTTATSAAESNATVQYLETQVAILGIETETSTPATIPQSTETPGPTAPIIPTEISSTEIPNPVPLWSNSWSQGYGFDAYSAWRGYRNLIRDVAWATDGEGEFQGERVFKVSIKDDLLPENRVKYEEGSGIPNPGYFELDWRQYIRVDGFGLHPSQLYSPSLELPIVYESSFMVGEDFTRANDDSSPMTFYQYGGGLNLLSLTDTIDENGIWYLMANVGLEGPLDRLYPVVISSGDVRGDPQRNTGDVYLNQLTPYGQQHPLRTNTRYWYQVVVTADRRITVSFKDAREGGYHVYLKGSLSNAVNPKVTIFNGPLSVSWFGLGPEFRIISGTFIQGHERILTFSAPRSTPSPILTESTAIGTGLSTTLTAADSATMVLIPAGLFEMGSDADVALAECQQLKIGLSCERGWFLGEEPIHMIMLDDFYIDQYEVTNAHYAECVDAGECPPPSMVGSYTRINYYGEPQYDNHPVIYVSWDNAKMYCEWRGDRLPTEAEWEKAARGVDGRMYPWDGAFDGSRVNFCDRYCMLEWADADYDDGYADTAPVGSYPNGVSVYGAYDMAGNVLEWVADWLEANYYGNSPTVNPKGPSSGEFRVVRGGAWNVSGHDVRVAYRDASNPSSTRNDLGFRCARSP